MTVGLATVAAGGFGWLIGPVAGNAVFGLVYRGWRGEMRVVSFFSGLFDGRSMSLSPKPTD